MTSEVALRRFVSSDAGLLFELDNNREVMRYINGGQPVSLAEIEQNLLPQFLRERDLGFWCVEVAGHVAGWVSVRRRPPSAVAELGYRLKPDFWGQGVATTAARLAIAQGFAAGFKKIYGTTYEKNQGSIRVMQKLGMTLVREFRWEGEPSDTAVPAEELWDGFDVEYALTSDQFR